MHEISFAKYILNQIENKDKVKELEIEVGELAGVSGEDLKETIEKMTGWNIKIKEMDSKVKCDCGYLGRAKIKGRGHDIVIYACPKCGLNPEVLSGSNIKLNKVVYF